MSIVKKSLVVGALVAVVAGLGGAAAHAATTANSQLTQVITAGALSTLITNAAGVEVTNPAFPMSSVTVKTTAQTSTGTFGTNDSVAGVGGRITVDNATGTGTWTLALAGAPAAQWDSGTAQYPFNAATAAAGQLTVNPAVGTITANNGGTLTGITTGASATYSGAVTSINLMQASAAANPVWNGYITGIGLSQQIPANTPAGNYVLNMVQTVTAA